MPLVVGRVAGCDSAGRSLGARPFHHVVQDWRRLSGTSTGKETPANLSSIRARNGSATAMFTDLNEALSIVLNAFADKDICFQAFDVTGTRTVVAMRPLGW